jgi:hypothetical protein
MRFYKLGVLTSYSISIVKMYVSLELLLLKCSLRDYLKEDSLPNFTLLFYTNVT